MLRSCFQTFFVSTLLILETKCHWWTLIRSNTDWVTYGEGSSTQSGEGTTTIHITLSAKYATVRYVIVCPLHTLTLLSSAENRNSAFFRAFRARNFLSLSFKFPPNQHQILFVFLDVFHIFSPHKSNSPLNYISRENRKILTPLTNDVANYQCEA